MYGVTYFLYTGRFVYKYQTKLLYETSGILIRNVGYFYTKCPVYEMSGILCR